MPKKVFVSGCFDMLHSGHVAFFEEAATHGDLYVGIGSDRTISDLKGRFTVNGERERLYMIKSLKVVKDAWINRGSGLLDFEEELRERAHLQRRPTGCGSLCWPATLTGWGSGIKPRSKPRWRCSR